MDYQIQHAEGGAWHGRPPRWRWRARTDCAEDLAVAVNGASVGALGDGSNPDNPRLINTDAIRYNTDKGLWQQRTLKFDAALLKPGENTMTFTVPAGDVQSGVVWDYLRLELDENARMVNPTPAQPGR